MKKMIMQCSKTKRKKKLRKNKIKCKYIRSEIHGIIKKKKKKFKNAMAFTISFVLE